METSHSAQPEKQSIDAKSQFGESIYHEITNSYGDDSIEGDRSSTSTVTSMDKKPSSTNMTLSSSSNINLDDKNKYINNKNNDYSSCDVETFTENTPAIEYKTYPIAWVLLFFMVVLRSAVAIYNNTFSPIPTVTAEFLGISLSKINWLYNIMGLAYVLTSFFTSWLYQKAGIKWSIFIAGVLLTTGCWIRWIAVKINPPSFPIMMVGQTIAAISSPISLNIMTAFATLWFAENRRATAGMFIVSNYGAIIAMFLMPTIATGKDRIEFTVIIVAVIASVATIPLFFFPKKPSTPASAIQTDSQDSKNKLTLRQSTLILIKNPNFLILCVVHGLNIGLSIAWNGLMNQAMTPYGYTNNQVGNIAAVSIVAGTLGCVISGPVLDKTKQHKILLKIMAPLMCSTYVAFIFIIKKDTFVSILYVNALSQFFLSFMVPVCVELGVEISYPVTESLSTSILWQIAQLIGFILVFIMDLFRDENGTPHNNMYRALIFQACIAGVCALFALFFNGRMLRTEALQEKLAIDNKETKDIENAIHQRYDSCETIHVLENGTRKNGV